MFPDSFEFFWVKTLFVWSYNNERLHIAIGHITSADMMAGQAAEIHALTRS